MIVTAREAGYREEAVFGDDFTRLDVQDLDEQQITTLVDNWCRRLYPEDVVGSRDKLVNAIGNINELRQERDLPSLVSTPLLVTMVVSVQWGETELPRERARLYEACVKAIIQAQYIPDDPARQALWIGAGRGKRSATGSASWRWPCTRVGAPALRCAKSECARFSKRPCRPIRWTPSCRPCATAAGCSRNGASSSSSST